MKKVLAVQNIACETLGTFERLLEQDGFAVESISAQTDRMPRDAQGYSALVILGGPMAVYDNLQYLQQEQELIRRAIGKNVPVLGICLGSQLIAQAAGGRVFKGKGKEIGWHKVSITAEGQKGLFAGAGREMTVFQWHGDTYELPEQAKVLARSDLYPQSFQIGSAVGVQFHLEVDERMIRSWLKEYRAEVKAEGLDEREILSPAARDIAASLEEKCRLVYRNFFQNL